MTFRSVERTGSIRHVEELAILLGAPIRAIRFFAPHSEDVDAQPRCATLAASAHTAISFQRGLRTRESRREQQRHGKPE